MSFESKLICFWVAVCAVVIYLRMRPQSSVARAALSWIGPTPSAGEPWARFQWRRALYSLSWFFQLLFAMSAIFLLFMRDSGAYEGHTWLQVVWFGLPLGAGVALLAFVGFMCKAIKARFIGPNPIFAPEAQPSVPDGPASAATPRRPGRS